MARFLFALACSALTLLQCQAQDKSPLEEILSFEKGGAAGGSPVGWNGGPAGTIFADDKVVHSGRWSARIERVSNSANTFSALTTFIPVDFTGKSIELRGFLRLEDVSDFAGLWMREDGPTPALAFDNMQRRQVNGTRTLGKNIQSRCHSTSRQPRFSLACLRPEPARRGRTTCSCWWTANRSGKLPEPKSLRPRSISTMSSTAVRAS